MAKACQERHETLALARNRDLAVSRYGISDRVTSEEPLRRGCEARLWELPMCFELDDWPHFQFAFGPPYRAGL